MAKKRSTSLKARKEHAMQVAQALAKHYASAECALNHKNAFELLVATILSAQCTDKAVNLATPKLFAKYPTPAKMAAAKQEDIEEIIRTLGFFRAKATNIRAMSQKLVDEHEGQVPKDLEQLVELPGVGRKTANVVLGTAFGIASGVVVDTHVKRLTQLIGLTKATTPEQIELEMMELLPPAEWVNFSHRLIHHGRQICIARRPKCPICPLLSICGRIGLPPLSEYEA